MMVDLFSRFKYIIIKGKERSQFIAEFNQMILETNSYAAFTKCTYAVQG